MLWLGHRRPWGQAAGQPHPATAPARGQCPGGGIGGTARRPPHPGDLPPGRGRGLGSSGRRPCSDVHAGAAGVPEDPEPATPSELRGGKAGASVKCSWEGFCERSGGTDPRSPPARSLVIRPSALAGSARLRQPTGHAPCGRAARRGRTARRQRRLSARRFRHGPTPRPLWGKRSVYRSRGPRDGTDVIGFGSVRL